MKHLKSFGRFWWNFVIGDDWRVAVGVIAALCVTALLVNESLPAWWLLPPVVVALLADSLRRAIRSPE